MYIKLIKSDILKQSLDWYYFGDIPMRIVTAACEA